MSMLVLGAGGMAGHVVATHFRERGWDVVTATATQRLDDDTVLLDVTDRPALDEVLAQAEWDVVVNCIGLLVQESDRRPDLAAYLNGYFPHLLERRFAGTRTKLVHISTDCVFSGEHPPYREDSEYDGQLFYDRSKALGEIRNDKDLTFRMSIIGPDMKPAGTGLFNWFHAQAGPISGYVNAMWTGVTTIELARGIEAALDQGLTGLYHFVPDHNISKFDLLELFRAEFGRTDITLNRDGRAAPDKTLLNTRSDFDYEVPTYAAMVADMRRWIEDHAALYSHYAPSGVTT